MAHPVSQDRAFAATPSSPQAVSPVPASIPLREAKVCHSIIRFCKRGHLRTKETTFERKVRVKGKDYIVRDCRVCHAMRNNRTKASWSKFQSKSKWSAIRNGSQPA